MTYKCNYSFTTLGSKPQTKYYHVGIRHSDTNQLLYETVVSTPLKCEELHKHLADRLYDRMGGKMSIETSVAVAGKDSPEIVGLDTICRIISNIKPISYTVYVGNKVYTIDNDKVQQIIAICEKGA